MAYIGETVVKVKPDLSAFREADTETIAELLWEQLEQRLDRRFNLGDMRVVVGALQQRFTILG